MKRLTERHNGWVMRKGCHGPCKTCHRVECADICPMIDRLAAYEDTGLELKDHEYRAYANLGKALRQVRRKSREAKDTLSTLTPVLVWVESNRAVIKSLERLLGDVRKAEKIRKTGFIRPEQRGKGGRAWGNRHWTGLKGGF